MQLWMSNKGKENEQKWTEDSTSADRTLQSPFTMDSRHGRKLRERAHRGDDLSNILGHSVPAAFKPVLECMRFKCTNTENNRTVNENDYANVMKPHTKEQWLRAIRYICIQEHHRKESSVQVLPDGYLLVRSVA